MNKARIIFCSDVHLCHIDWYGMACEDRLEKMICDLNEFYAKKPYDIVVFLGDYSLDFWEWDIRGSWLNSGVSNTDNFVKRYAKNLKVSYAMLPGNHEQYGNQKWKEITGFDRQYCFETGGYLIIMCDNFSGDLDPDYHSDGIYTSTDLKFIKQKMDEHPKLPVILCSHYFDITKEPVEFFDFIKNEKRISLLVCGHDHNMYAEDLGEKADHVCLYHDGHYSFTNNNPNDIMWGFCLAELSDDGIDICYVEPESTFEYEGKQIEHKYCEKEHIHIKRLDI